MERKWQTCGLMGLCARKQQNCANSQRVGSPLHSTCAVCKRPFCSCAPNDGGDGSCFHRHQVHNKRCATPESEKQEQEYQAATRIRTLTLDAR
jgi:hypothetical protein